MKNVNSKRINTVEELLSEADKFLLNKKFPRAIDLYQSVIQKISRETEPEVYFHAINNIGIAYCGLSDISGKQENIAIAIKNYEDVLEVFSAEKEPVKYATAKKNLGNAYLKLLDAVSTEENYDNAVSAEVLNSFKKGRYFKVKSKT